MEWLIFFGSTDCICEYCIYEGEPYLRAINKNRLDIERFDYVVSLSRDVAVKTWNDSLIKEIERLKGLLYTENI
ncbi:TPA: hypothetical protein ACMWN4_002176 [Clostridioides difficile]